MEAGQLVGRFKRFIADTFLLGEDIETLKVDESLLEQGVIDSTGVIELVHYIEQDFGIEVPDADVIPANFGSISGLVAYVRRQVHAA
jgi:acyl carrier protein